MGSRKKVTSTAKEGNWEYDCAEDKKLYTSKKATVEVTVKVKKLRHRDDDHKHKAVDMVEKIFPKGSYGDLLMGNKDSRELVANAQDQKRKPTKSNSKTQVINKCSTLDPHDDGDGNQDCQKAWCQKIPINSQIYLETHTHVRGKSSSPHNPKLQLKTRREPIEANANDTIRRLQMENDVLRKRADGLRIKVEQAEKKQKESIMTIKELYQLAELLKRENQQLIAAQERYHLLQEKLLLAVSENQELKEYLESLMNKQKESTTHKDDKMNQLEKIRSVIQEVKSTIQEEIQGITSNNSGSSSINREALRGFDFNITGGESGLLNDSNASEIRRILGSYEFNHSHLSLSNEQLSGIM